MPSSRLGNSLRGSRPSSTTRWTTPSTWEGREVTDSAAERPGEPVRIAFGVVVVAAPDTTAASRDAQPSTSAMAAEAVKPKQEPQTKRSLQLRKKRWASLTVGMGNGGKRCHPFMKNCSSV
eukprot:2495861-Amphidinium_carterae.1